MLPEADFVGVAEEPAVRDDAVDIDRLAVRIVAGRSR